MAWRYAAKEHQYPAYIGEIFIGVGCLVWLTLTLFLLSKGYFIDKVFSMKLNIPLQVGLLAYFQQRPF